MRKEYCCLTVLITRKKDRKYPIKNNLLLDVKDLVTDITLNNLSNFAILNDDFEYQNVYI